MQTNLQACIRCWPLESSAAMQSESDIRNRLRYVGISLKGVEYAYNVRVWCMYQIFEQMWMYLTLRETEEELDEKLHRVAMLWLYGLQPAKEELTRPASPSGLLELATLRQILKLFKLGHLPVGPDWKSGVEGRARLRTLLEKLSIPARFEP